MLRGERIGGVLRGVSYLVRGADAVVACRKQQGEARNRKDLNPASSLVPQHERTSSVREPGDLRPALGSRAQGRVGKAGSSPLREPTHLDLDKDGDMVFEAPNPWPPRVSYVGNRGDVMGKQPFTHIPGFLREDAEDAVQDAYVRAFRAFDTFAGAGARAWLLAIVRNVAYSALQARKRSRNVITLSEELSLGDSVDAVSQEPSPEAIVIAQEGQQLLLDALTKLPPIHRDILVLREMEGLSYAEISQITGVAIGTVMSRLSRARAELLRSVRGQYREPMDKSRAVLKGWQYLQ